MSPIPALMEVSVGAQKLLHQAARLGKRLDGRVLDQVPSTHPRSTTLPAARETQTAGHQTLKHTQQARHPET